MIGFLNELNQVWQQVCEDLVVRLQFLLDHGQFKVGVQSSLLEGSFSGLADAKLDVLQLTDFCSDRADLVSQLLLSFGVCMLSLPQQNFDFVKHR